MVNNRWARLSQNEKAELLGIYTSMGYNDLASIIAHYNSCGGKLKADGGPVTNTAQYKSDAYLYTPPVNVGAPIEVPLRYKPLPDYGDYVPQRTTGMLEDIPIELGLETPQRGYGVLMPDAPSAIPTLDARQDAARRIMAVENSKNNVNGGYDAKTGRWYPHKSHEGGADTIAYGIKLSNGTPEAALALKQGYLTDEQAVSAVDSLVQKYYDAAKRVYDGRYGAGEWDKLSDKSQSILVDYSYNPGLAKFPKLMEGFHSGNLDLIRKNYKRYSGGKELGRNKVLLEELDTLENEYPIFRAEGGRIHIKPENRGKFTALKKRTGHSASWFKAHGTPAQKKMAVFALNSRKWKHGDGGPLDNYFYDGGPYGVVPLGGDYLNYLQTMPEVSGGSLEPAVVTASLPEKFNGSQEAARRYAEGYQKGAKPVSEAMNRAGQDIFRAADTVAGFIPGPIGMIDWLGHMGADAAEGNWGKVGRDVALAIALGAGARGVGWLKNYIDDATNFGEDIFRAFTDSAPERVSTNFTYLAPAARATMEAVPAATKAYEIADLGGGYMLKSLMRGNPLEKQISKNGTVNVNNVRAIVGKGSKVEQAVVDKVLASEEFAGKKSIDYNKFRKAVQDELITYDRTPDTRWSDYGMGRIGQGMDGSPNARKAVLGAKTHMDRFNAIDVYGTPAERSSVRNLTFDLREGKISESDYDEKFNSIYNAFSDRIVGNSTPETFVFSSSRIPSGSAKHYDPNTLGHSRTYTSMDEPDVLHVMESQSDWAQSRRGNMLTEPINEASANEYKTYLEDRIKELEAGGYDEAQITPFREELQRHLSRWKVGYDSNSVQEQSNHLINNYTSRQIQENLRYAAEKGQTKMRYPTRETAAKIEGYPKKSAVENNPEFNKLFKSLESEFAEKYSLMLPPRDIIMNHPNIRSYFSELGLDISDDTIKLIHDIRGLKPVDGYLPSHETILKKYSDFPKQFKKIFKGSDVRTVTDPKGNTWYEVDVPENYLQQEWTYKSGGPLREFTNISDLF